jgi:hypothetical protein
MTESSLSRQEQDISDQDIVVIGSPAHKHLFCHMLLDSYDPYRPAVIAWPDLAPDALARVTGLPFWDIAVETEEAAGRRMQALADATDDKLIHDAVALNAFEERRHKEVLGHMIRHYGIALGDLAEPDPIADPQWGFVRTGYGECFDSFFAFGLFALAKQSGFFPPPLLEVFEPIVQEEARHNLFFVNWVAYMRANGSWAGRVRLDGQCLAALWRQAWGRVGAAQKVDGTNFTRIGGEAIGLDLKPRDFLALCVAENDRRLAPYDRRLLRPRLMPGLARAFGRFLPGAKKAA